jgi:Dolichyl-phosphate-mannose-protein mannosyltransferase
VKISASYHADVSAWFRRNLIASSLIILFASSVPRLFLTWRTDVADVLVSDAVTYFRPAQNLIRQQAFIGHKGEPEVTRTPGYPAFLASIMILVGEDPHRVLMVQAFILSTEVMVLYWLARRILPPVTAFIAGLLAAFSPWGAFLAGIPMTEGLFLLLLALIFFAMKLTAEVHNQTALAVGGICTGLLTAAAVLVRPIWPLVLLVGGALFCLYGPRRKGVWLLLSTTLVFAVTPVFLWKARNQQVRQFNGLSDIAGKCAWQYLASRVNARVNNQNRWVLQEQARDEQDNWKMSIAEADQERWRRAKAVFTQHPVLTGYYFLLSSAEHAVHPSPSVLSPAKLNFRGDYWVLALLWGGLLILAGLGCLHNLDSHKNGTTDRHWLIGLLIVCLMLTLSSGLCFGAGSRYRVPLEIVVPLLAAAGLLRVFSLFTQTGAPLTTKPVPAKR